MMGLMQDWPLLVHTILDHAAWLGRREVVSRTVEGPIHRYSYGDLERRARMIAGAGAKRLGIAPGDVVGTMAWNTYRHAEIWYGLMGMGAVVHTINPRLFADQLAYIINHAEDRWLFLDLTFVKLLEDLSPRLPKVKGYIVMTDESHMPASSQLPNLLCYETLLAEGDPAFAWPKLDERTAAGICYTSGTTGNPKGVLYSHRSTVLCAMMNCAGDALALASRDTVMPVVPMYHANAWSLIFAAPMAGAKLVLPGPKLDGASLYELIVGERVTFTAAVPTLWLGLLNFLNANPALAVPDLERVVIGGSACPEAMMRTFIEQHGTDVIHAWGMTEMSPIGSINTPRGGLEQLDAAQQWQLKLKQGRPQYGVEMKIVDDDGRDLPHDGQTFGRLKVRGVAVAAAYYEGRRQRVLRCRGLVRHRRYRDHRRERLHADHRPGQGRDQVGRRMDLVDRSRERRHELPRRGGSGGNRPGASEMGRKAVAGDRAERRRGGDARGRACPSQRPDRQMVDAGRRRVRGRAAAHRNGQDLEARAA